MKLRNKKTDAVANYRIILQRETGNGSNKAPIKYVCGTLTKLNEEWEDYKPKEPLIKDEKIRKAVRAWAEANNVPNDVKLDVFEYLGTGTTAIRYRYKAKTLPHERCVQFEYISSDEIYNSQNDRDCTIAELCGEEEE